MIYFFLPLILISLYFGKFLLIPLLFALLIFLVLKSLSEKLITIKINGYGLNYNKSFLVICLSVLYIIYLIGFLIEINLSNVLSNSENYQKNFLLILNFIEEKNLKPFLSIFEKIITNINLNKIFSKTLEVFADMAGNFSLVLIYLVFFFLEEKFFKSKIKKIFINKSSQIIFQKINDQIYNYFQIKIFTSMITGLLTFIILFFSSNDLSIFFGILAFILNFIPFIGSLISIILPFLFSLIQDIDFFSSMTILIFLFLIQMLIGNFFEPKLMGKSLNLSPMIMLITLSIMGKLWGISGMFLSVPLLVILLIIFSNIKSTKKIAIFLSEKGNIS